MWATTTQSHPPPASRKRKRKRWAKSTVHAPLSKKPQTDGRPALGPQRAPGDPTRAVRCRPQDAMDGPMRRLPMSARRYMYAGVAPRAASLALPSPRPPETKRGKQEPTAHTTHRNAAGRGGGRRRQRRRLQKAGRGYLLAYLSLPLIYYCPAPFNLPGRVNENKRKNCCVAIQSIPPLPAA